MTVYGPPTPPHPRWPDFTITQVRQWGIGGDIPDSWVPASWPKYGDPNSPERLRASLKRYQQRLAELYTPAA